MRCDNRCVLAVCTTAGRAHDYTVAMVQRPKRLVASVFFCAVAVFVAAASRAALTAQEHQHPSTGGAHHHPDAAKIVNPVAADARSIAAGRELYQKHCAGCHGETGKGDGMMGEELDPKPADLTDAEWKHGS